MLGVPDGAKGVGHSDSDRLIWPKEVASPTLVADATLLLLAARMG